MTGLATPAARYGLPAVASVVLHAMVAALLLVNWSSRSEATITPRVKPRAIEARLVIAESLQQEKKQPAAEPASRPRPQVAARPKPKPKPKPRPKVEKPEPKPEPVVEKKVPDQQELARRAQQELALAMDAEDILIEEATEHELTLSYIALIARTIEENWSRPPSARNEMEAELVLQLIPTGEVVSVSVARSSGNLAVDRSAVNAVQKAERFPELQQLEGRLGSAVARWREAIAELMDR